jgi:signal transduction histidine kinase
MAMWIDTAGTATWQQARTQTFAPVEGNINLGYQPGVLWVRVQVQRGETLEGWPLVPGWLLEVSPVFLDNVTLWIEPSGRRDDPAVVEPTPQQAGASMHPEQRPLWHRNSVLLVNLPQAGLYTLWLRVATDTVTAATPVLWQVNAHAQETQIKTMSSGLFFGVYICIILTALILGFTVGTPIFLLCAGFFFLLGLRLFIAEGWFGLFFTTGRPHFLEGLLTGCSALLAALFPHIFFQLLKIDKFKPRFFAWYLRISWAAALVAVLLLVAGHFSQVVPLVNMLAMLQVLVILVLMLWVIPRDASVRWVGLALTPLLLPNMIRLARNAGFDFFIAWVDISLLLGFTLHAMLLLFFVARRVGQSYQSNLHARAEVIVGATQLVEQRDFISLLSHEFRNPLAVLDGALSNLNRQSLDTEVSNRVGRMARAVDRLKYVLGYCLADERLASFELAQRLRSPLSAAEIIEESLKQLDDESGRLQLLPADAASQALLDGGHMLGDLPMLGVALKNLLDNALKYGPSGPVQLTVHAHDGQVTFVVRDYGPGISAPESGQLFNKFMRGQQHLHMPGAGLGLPLSLKIVKQHGGDISIRNASGGGAVAELTLPLVVI